MKDCKVNLKNPIEHKKPNGEILNILSVSIKPPTSQHQKHYIAIKSFFMKCLRKMSLESQDNSNAGKGNSKDDKINPQDINNLLMMYGDSSINIYEDFRGLLFINNTVYVNDDEKLQIIESVYNSLSMVDLELLLSSYISFFLNFS